MIISIYSYKMLPKNISQNTLRKEQNRKSNDSKIIRKLFLTGKIYKEPLNLTNYTKELIDIIKERPVLKI